MRIPGLPPSMRVLGAAILPLLVAAFASPPRRVLLTTIDMAAPSSRVRAVLADTAAYGQWNPFMRLSGRLAPGQVIEHVEIHGGDRTVFHPKLLAVRPDRELRWFGRVAVPGVLDAEHWFLLRPHDAGTRPTQGERLRGLAVCALDIDGLRQRFAAVNTALRARAERPRRLADQVSPPDRQDAGQDDAPDRGRRCLNAC